MKIALLFAFLAHSLAAQALPIPGPGPHPGGGGGSITLLANKLCQSTSQTSGCTTAVMSCSGGNWLGVVVSNNGNANPATSVAVSSSPSNTFSHTSNYGDSGNNSNVAIFYVASASLNASTTVTCGTSGANFVSCTAMCFSNLVSGAKDMENGNTVATTTCQPGSITPSASGYLLVSGFSSSTSSGTITVDSNYSITDTGLNTGNAEAVGGAQQIQSVAAAINPTWTVNSGAVDNSCVQASFVK